MQPEFEILPLTTSRTLLTRFENIHRRQGIGIFGSPPGVGKSTAIHAFAARYPDSVGIVTLSRKKTNARDVLRYVVHAVRRLRGERGDGHVYNDTHMIAGQLKLVLKGWSQDHRCFLGDEPCRMTIIFDEAQYLARDALDELRYWNDRPDDTIPFKLGLIFVGNHELSLKVGDDGKTVISQAVGDRARFIEAMSYSDITNEDLAMFVRSRGVDDPEAVQAIVKYFSSPRAIRSLRRVADLVEDTLDYADGKQVTAEIVNMAV